MWKFAACHSFFELEEYCRYDTFVSIVLKYILSLHSHGLEALARHGIKLEMMSRVVRDLMNRSIITEEGKQHCLGCGTFVRTPVCAECKRKGAECFNWDIM